MVKGSSSRNGPRHGGETTRDQAVLLREIVAVLHAIAAAGMTLAIRTDRSF
jgi:hypothetical protein